MAWRALLLGSGKRSGAGAIAGRATVLISVVATVLSVKAAALVGPPPTAQPPEAGSVAAPADTAGWGGGCGKPMGSRSSDARFIVMMIPHHEGAIAMAELALQRSRRAEIRALAESIRTSQSREIAQMRRWYRQWFGSAVPAWPGPAADAGPGMGMGMGMGMPGFAASLEALRQAPDFDRTFLEQMIAHHRMGVMMAAHAQWGTVHPKLRELEAAMVRVQSDEIAQMSRWLAQGVGAPQP